MLGEEIPNEDHIARYCRPMQVEDGNIQATAFMLRPGEPYLSVNWLEFLNCSDRHNEIAELRNIYSKKLNNVGQRAKLAVLNVGDMCNNVLSESTDMRHLKVFHDPVVHDDPKKSDPSHSGIYNLKQDDELIAELILETVRDTYAARG